MTLVTVSWAAVLLVAIMTSPMKGVGRFLAPDVQSALILFMIFGVRPWIPDRLEGKGLYGIDPSKEGMEVALAAGLVAAFAFACGLLVARLVRLRGHDMAGHSRISRWRSRPERHRMTVGKTLVWALVGAGAYSAAVIAASGFEGLSVLSGGRSEEATIAGFPEFLAMLPISGPVAIAFFLVQERCRPILMREWVMLSLPLGVSLGFVSMLGQRRFMIPCLLIPLLGYCLGRVVRVKWWHIATGFTGLLTLATVPMVRSAGARRPGEELIGATIRYVGEEGLVGTLRPVIASYDTEMLDYIAVVAGLLDSGGEPGFGFGRGTFLEFLSRPLPSGIFPASEYSDRLLTELYGGPCGDPVCPVASVVGVSYFDFGLIGVFCAVALLAGVLRVLAAEIQFPARRSNLSLVFVCIGGAFALVATRTNTVHALWWALYVLMIAAGISFITSRFGFMRNNRRASIRKLRHT